MTKQYKSQNIVTYSEVEDLTIEISIAVDSEFKSTVGTNLENFGSIEIKFTCIEDKACCFWDNIDFFLNSDRETIKQECIGELRHKKMNAKGLQKEIQKILKQYVKLGYLKASVPAERKFEDNQQTEEHIK